MTSRHLRESARRHWFWIALVLVVVAGYQAGKDRALGENAEALATGNSS